MTIEQLQAAMTALVGAAEAETRSLTADEVEQYESLETSLIAANKTAEIAKRNAAYNAPNVQTRPITGGLTGDAVLTRAFDHYMRTGMVNSDVLELRAQTLTTTGGGYTIPTEMANTIVDVRKAYGGIRSVAQVINTSGGNPIAWPSLDDTANVGEVVALGSTIGGGNDLVFGTVTLGAHTYMSGGASQLPLRVPKALLQDSAFDIETMVVKKLAERINRQQAAEFAKGDGTGNPKGLFYKASTVQTASGGAITYTALLDLVHSVDPEYRNGACFVFNDGTLKRIRQVLDANDRPLWLPSTGGLADSLPGGTLLGYKVVLDQGSPDWSATATDDVPAGTGSPNEGYIAFGQISEGYIIRDVASMDITSDPYGRAAYNEIQFFATARADATQQNNAAYKLLQGYFAP